MAKKPESGHEDIDYLVVSARIRARESKLLNRNRMEQILEATGDDEVERVLQECGYSLPESSDPEVINKALADIQKEMLRTLLSSIPDTRFLDVFRIKYDYHNAKALLKSKINGRNVDGMLIAMGRTDVQELRDAFRRNDYILLPDTLAQAIAEAGDVLSAKDDPQLCDIIMDRYMFTEMYDIALATHSAMLMNYVSIQIDVMNLRAVVRTLRMKKNADFLENILVEGGSVPVEDLMDAVSSGGEISALYENSTLGDAAEAGHKALEGGSLTEFERLCDDSVNEFIYDMQLYPFGEAALICYLTELETEFVNLRVLLLGRKAGLDPESLRQRLRITNM